MKSTSTRPTSTEPTSPRPSSKGPPGGRIGPAPTLHKSDCRSRDRRVSRSGPARNAFVQITKGAMSGNAGETPHEDFKINGQYVDTRVNRR